MTTETLKSHELLRRFGLIHRITQPRNSSADPTLRACQDQWGKWHLAAQPYTEKKKWGVTSRFETLDDLLNHVAKGYAWALKTNELHPEYVERLERMNSK